MTVVQKNMKKPIQAIKVFISYKWEDDTHIEWVERLARDLRQRGINALLDKWEVPLGESFSTYMTSAISKSDVFLFIMTPSSVKAAESQNKGGAVRFEVQIATARKIAGERFRFIGILRKGKRVATHLRDCRYIDFRDDNAYPLALARLVNELRGISEKPSLPAKLNLNLIAEPVIHHIWHGLPHARWYLVEPASTNLQQAIWRGLLRLVKEHSEDRGYRFNLLRIDLTKCTPHSLINFLRNDISRLVNRKTKPLKALKNHPEIQEAYYQRALSKDYYARSVIVFSWDKEPNNVFETLLYCLKAWRDRWVIDGELPISTTVIVLAFNLEFDWDSRYSSSSANIFEIISTDEDAT